jgi:hypothetical protein
VEKEETVKTIKKDPILECTHKNVEKCHYVRKIMLPFLPILLLYTCFASFCIDVRDTV